MTNRSRFLHELMKGYVTTAASISGKSASQVEDALGFQPGALDSGFVVFALIGYIQRNDFIWKDQTRYSGGWHLDRSIGYYVQRNDELRAYYLVEAKPKLNEVVDVLVDRKLNELKDEQARRLNVRIGPGRIMKVCPNRAHGRSFPDSRQRGIPQWELCVLKAFVRVAEVPAGGQFR